jgi:ABC-type Fe3+/spermidine/putrescine transport system ATPase subunit
VHGLTLSLGTGRILALLGPSGSGKTTTLRLHAGFESPDQGRILVGGEDVTRLPPVTRRFGMVFQHYALFPHLDVGANVAFGLEGRGLARDERERRAAAALAAVDLAGFERREVASLSGGQQQRVALARALAPEPRVLLLDEPLSNLDPTLRERTRQELRELIERIGITTVLVTHEQEEAFDLADQVALLNAGRLEQLGTPEDLYHAPASPFVAGFVGRAAILEVVVVEPGSTARVRLPGGGEVDLPVGSDRVGPAALCLRPEAIRLRPAAGGGARVVHRRFLGARSLLTVAWDGAVVEAEAGGGGGGGGGGGEAGGEEPAEVKVGDLVDVEILDRGVILFPREAR